MIPTLTTDRLILRPNRPADFEPFAAFYASDRARLRGGVKSRAEAFLQFAAEIGHWTIRGYGFWAVEEAATGAYCGQVGLWFPDGWAEREIGWMVVADKEGQGIAREAALRARAYAYDDLGWPEAFSCIADGNTRSIALAERLGARFDRRHPRPGQPDHLVYRHPAPSEIAA
ncbi:MAG: GNAT family N-acetyltransferase [Pseudomonadota bacterium]